MALCRGAWFNLTEAANMAGLIGGKDAAASVRTMQTIKGMVMLDMAAPQ